jgi:hypothetical protein
VAIVAGDSVASLDSADFARRADILAGQQVYLTQIVWCISHKFLKSRSAEVNSPTNSSTYSYKNMGTAWRRSTQPTLPNAPTSSLGSRFSQPPHKIVNLLITVTHFYLKHKKNDVLQKSTSSQIRQVILYCYVYKE